MQINLIHTHLLSYAFIVSPGPCSSRRARVALISLLSGHFCVLWERLSQSCSTHLEREDGLDPSVWGRNWRFLEPLASQGSWEVAAGSY